MNMSGSGNSSIYGIVMMTIILGSIGSFVIYQLFVCNSCGLFSEVYGYHGEEVSINIGYAHFISQLENKDKQIKIFVNYTANDPSIVDQGVNAVMKVYAENGTAIKTSSYPNGFTLDNTGTLELKTGIKDNIINNITAVVQFTDLKKIQPISEAIAVKLTLGQIIK